MVKKNIKNQNNANYKELEESLIKNNEELEKKNTQLQIELEASKIVHESLREGQNFLQEVLLSQGETLVMVIDENYLINFVWGSKKLEKKYGIDFQSLMGQLFNDFCSNYITGEYPELLSEFFNESKTLREKVEVKMPLGVFWWDITFSRIMDDNNEIWTIVVTARDVTQLKELKVKFHAVADVKLIENIGIDQKKDLILKQNYNKWKILKHLHPYLMVFLIRLQSWIQKITLIIS